MSEEIVFKKNGENLAGTLYGESKVGVLLCPPHPDFGGNRYDRRLVEVAKDLANHDISAFCIDYQPHLSAKERVKDVLAGISYFKEKVEKMGLFGYSYGSVIASNAATQTSIEVKGLVLLAPIKIIDGLEINLKGDFPKLMIGGSEDPYLANNFENLFSKAEGRKEKLVLKTDHFYFGFEKEVAERVREFFTSLFF